jgi:hypothetical protein
MKDQSCQVKRYFQGITAKGRQDWKLRYEHALKSLKPPNKMAKKKLHVLIAYADLHMTPFTTERQQELKTILEDVGYRIYFFDDDSGFTVKSNAELVKLNEELFADCDAPDAIARIFLLIGMVHQVNQTQQ